MRNYEWRPLMCEPKIVLKRSLLLSCLLTVPVGFVLVLHSLPHSLLEPQGLRACIIQTPPNFKLKIKRSTLLRNCVNTGHFLSVTILKINLLKKITVKTWNHYFGELFRNLFVAPWLNILHILTQNVTTLTHI